MTQNPKKYRGSYTSSRSNFYIFAYMEGSQNTLWDFCFKNTFWYTRAPRGWQLWRFKSGEHFKIQEVETGKLLKKDFTQLGLTCIY